MVAIATAGSRAQRPYGLGTETPDRTYTSHIRLCRFWRPREVNGLQGEVSKAIGNPLRRNNTYEHIPYNQVFKIYSHVSSIEIALRRTLAGPKLPSDRQPAESAPVRTALPIGEAWKVYTFAKDRKRGVFRQITVPTLTILRNLDELDGHIRPILTTGMCD